MALTRWQELDVPYEVATARMLLGLACRDAGDDEGALASFAAVESMFNQLGATPDVLRDLTSRRQLPGGLTEREAEVLRLRRSRALTDPRLQGHMTPHHAERSEFWKGYGHCARSRTRLSTRPRTRLALGTQPELHRDRHGVANRALPQCVVNRQPSPPVWTGTALLP
ncbi:MAG: hypothetical protein ABJD24_08965 [Acidimicrobiales bacterium]